MQAVGQPTSARKRRRLNPTETGPFVLRPVLEDIPLETEGYPGPVCITSVEYWNSHLYIGTSASEILHFVALPSDDEEEQLGPTFILASRLQPGGYESSPTQDPKSPNGKLRGIQRILVLPGPAKACVLCNGVVSFYTLPELSPAFSSKELSGVQWIGGVDEDESADGVDESVVMIANSKRILLVRVGEKLRSANSIEYPGCLKSSRRGTIACVADRNSYTLLEVEHQQKIPLFPISSVASQGVEEDIEPVVSRPDDPHSRLKSDPSGHSRSTSLGTFITGGGNRRSSPKPPEHDARGQRPPTSDAARVSSISGNGTSDAPLSVTPASVRPRSATDADKPSRRSPQRATSARPAISLRPHILSPSPSEFLLTTGSGKDEPGVGIFVNLDGDVVRGTIEFERYPDALSIQPAAKMSGQSSGDSPGGTSGDTIFSLVRKPSGTTQVLGLESQTLSADPAAILVSKAWLPISNSLPSDGAAGGLHCSSSPSTYQFPETGQLLRLVKYKGISKTPQSPAPSLDSDPRTRVAVTRVEEEKALFEAQAEELESNSGKTQENKRNAEELKFARGLGRATSQTLTWSGKDLWQVVANPQVLQLEASLWPEDDSLEELEMLEVPRIVSTIERIKDQEPQTETDFIGLTYIRQKASMMLLLHCLLGIGRGADIEERLAPAENTLLGSGTDPRLVLLLLPGVQDEVRESQHGIWIYQGLADLLRDNPINLTSMEAAPIEIWLMLRRYLSSWQEKRGYASISDEKHVFDSVDAALLLLLLYLDRSLPAGSGLQTSTRTKLNSMVDHWKGDFERGVALLEEHKRLFILSRLYQSRKLSKNVLQTWKRIAEGESDIGGEMNPATVEHRVRHYLVNIRDASVVKYFGLWLAGRNPDLAVQLFTDDACRVKFTPQEVTEMLKSHAPRAVQQYLEHLVFNKRLEQYADDLIGYYLDSVLSVLESSEGARKSLADSYSTYRALEKPKPTYQTFITETAPAESWWQSRLRLLQLLGSGSYATSQSSSDLTYSIPKVLDRLAPYSSYLVSESIILDARQGRHKEALQLLTHGLGDYDTAIRYCYFGGPTVSSSQPIDASFLPSRKTQSDLFSHLFAEFLHIEDETERIERASGLLAKFASYFDPLAIFNQLPESWTVCSISEFLQRTLRSVTSEYNEALILKALSASQNLQKQAAFVDACEKVGMKISTESSQDVGAEVS